MKKSALNILFLAISVSAAAQNIPAGKTAVIHSSYRVESTLENDASNPSKASISIEYYDGLGRPEQTLLYRNSPQSKDIIEKHTERDNYGRILKEYLPAPTLENTGSFKTDPLTAGTAFYNDLRPYRSPKGPAGTPESGFDDSPLNRMTRLYGEGYLWAANDKKTTFDYGTAELSLRRLYDLDAAGNIVTGTSYPVESLYMSSGLDEQGIKTTEVRDRQGRLLFSRQGVTAAATTAYIYDKKGRLAAVLQPEAYALSTGIAKDSPNWKNYVFAYEYDAKSRIIRKHIPGAGWTEIVYDRADRPVMSRDAYKKTLNRWSFTNYTVFNEPAFTGETTNSAVRATLQAAFDSHTGINEIWLGQGGYHGESFPNTANPPATDVKQYYFYDNYDSVSALNSNVSFQTSGAYHQPHTSAKGKLTGMVVYDQQNTNLYYLTAYYYDDKGRMIQQSSTHLKSGASQADRTDYEYNFAGEVLREKKIHKAAGQADLTHIIRNEYDHAGRLIKVFLKKGTEAEVETVRYSYDEIGRLKEKKLMPNGSYTLGSPDYIYRPPGPGNNTEDKAAKAVILQPGTLIAADTLGTYLAEIDTPGAGPTFSGLQSLRYSRHIRGGLRGINLDPAGNPIPDHTRGDLFAYKLDYETAGQWNGNIGKQSWNHVNGTNPTGIRDYTFSYDGLNRLKTADFTGVGSENYGIPNINYDRNGNITQLKRNGKKSNSFGLIDDLSYTYSGNRLMRVEDAVSGNHDVDFINRNSGSDDYDYYANGSLKKDLNESITNITYNTFLNLPEQITLSDGRWIKYTYDGSGALIKTEYSNGEYWEYANGMIYKNGQKYQFSIPEGRAVYENGSRVYEFEYNDHLGNTRVSFKADGNRLVQTAKSDTDPFGVVLKGTGLENSFQNRWEMQGKESEKTFGLNRVNFGARTYNPTIGRWDNVDPLAEQTMEPYLYAGNNPIRYTDPTGMSKDDIIIGKSLTDNFTTNQAFNTFAKTKEGIAYLSDYAKKGDVIAGHTYTEDGKYHKQGIDLVFEAKDLGGSTRGYTETSMNGDRANISFTINSNSKVGSQDGNTYDMGVLDQPYSKANTDIAVKGILSRTMTVFHETFIHGYSATKDFLDDKSFNNSNIDNSIKKSYGSYKNHWDHIQIQIGSDKGSQLFNTQGLNGIKSANSIWSSGKHYNNSQLGDMMWKFSGSWKK